jgi:UDP-glucose 4-epimerase
MTILVTGGAGYIGSHMVLALTEMGEEVVVLDNLSTGYWWAIAPEAKLVEGDIGDEALLDRIMAEYSSTRWCISRAPSWCRIRCAIRWATISTTR